MRQVLVFSLAIMAGLAGCSGGGSDQTADTGDRKYTLAVIPKGLGHQFWNTVKLGAEAAGEEFDAEILWNGPAKETEVAVQIGIVQDMINRGVDGIVMAACDENALVDTIQTAMEGGIPVVTIDSGVKSDLPISFVATDNVAGAAAAADTLAELVGGEGKVASLPFVPGAATSEMREEGFEKGLEKHPGLELAAKQHTFSDVAKAMSATQDILSSERDLAGIFASNEPACIGAMRAIEMADKAGDVKLVAFDASEDQVAALEAGLVQALVVQNPYRMGYDGVKAVIDHLEGRPVEKRIDTGVVVVTQENLNHPNIQELINPSGV